MMVTQEMLLVGLMAGRQVTVTTSEPTRDRMGLGRFGDGKSYHYGNSGGDGRGDAHIFWGLPQAHGPTVAWGRWPVATS